MKNLKKEYFRSTKEKAAEPLWYNIVNWYSIKMRKAVDICFKSIPVVNTMSEKKWFQTNHQGLTTLNGFLKVFGRADKPAGKQICYHSIIKSCKH